MFIVDLMSLVLLAHVGEKQNFTEYEIDFKTANVTNGCGSYYALVVTL